mgnify:CR=1 FL=1
MNRTIREEWTPIPKIPFPHSCKVDTVQVKEFTTKLNKELGWNGTAYDPIGACDRAGTDMNHWYDQFDLDPNGKPSKQPGPLTFNQWDRYAVYLHRLMDALYNEELEPKWAAIRFRKETDFRAGGFNAFAHHWLPFINVLPDQRTKHQAYHNVHDGLSLFMNMRKIPWSEAIEFRPGVLLATNSMEHQRNRIIKRLWSGSSDPHAGGVHIPPVVHYPVQGKITLITR